MLTATQPLRAVLPPRHGPSSFPSSGKASAGLWAPRRGAVSSSKVRCTSVSVSQAVVNGQAAIGTVVADVDQERQAGLLLTRRGEVELPVVTLKATVTLRLNEEWSTTEKVAGMVHQPWLLLEFFSSELDPKTGKEMRTQPHAASYSRMDGAGSFVYEVTVPSSSFGDVGAVVVENHYSSEVFISGIEVQHPNGAVNFNCSSWVTCHAGYNKRIFFPLESYLPSQTPEGVARLREMDLEAKRGDGHGERMLWQRIYDYAVYNDLGDPDKSASLRRPVLGGKEHPYPRRCRTGRPRCKADPSSETRAAGEIYVPRDEEFTARKAGAFLTKKVTSTLSAFTTAQEVAGDRRRSFPSLAAIDALYEDGYRNQPGQQPDNLNTYFTDLLEKQVELLLKGEKEEVKEDIRKVFKFQTPEIHQKDKLAWFRDEEFARETLAGMNPLSIQLVTELPIKSKLDEQTYGPGDSLITKELIEKQINGVMTADEAVAKKKLFMLDYYDMFLPYVHAVRELEGTTLYASRTVFFLEEEGTLRPVAIELTRPKSPNMPQWRQVFTPGSSVADSWLWQLAKAQVLAHDTGYHQLVSHWLRTHCCVEPYVIAANRQLSQMHPIYRLLHPHFRFTMEINAQARASLINADGVIESSFSPGKYSMLLSSGVYDTFWEFDKEALPADLLRRGMAFQRDDGELELTIKDYPYANDGLLIWDAIKDWVSEYVNHYYAAASDITGDKELQLFWTEVRTRGHADKRDEPWWPVLDSRESLVQVLSTIIWVASGHHAAVNFPQYPYAGYFPNHPTTARRNMPTETGDMRAFLEDPEKVLLDTFPSQYQSTLALPVLNLLSSHSAGEEYLGVHSEPAWMADAEMRAAFERFNGRMMDIAETIDRRNKDPALKNRKGPGVVPYVQLKPNYGDFKDMTSVMEMGIPTSISI
ncbi:unnamed protein product [Urochloa decumbens]|uniref:Lipoxygenase n=1 Tax=Urochloa decumbens TaxID=240449 RepID=A0ABC9DR43_9POAL